ncbi:MAG: hypothetical protein ACI8W3_002905, partial [Myxococcota bacterium]
MKWIVRGLGLLVALALLPVLIAGIYFGVLYINGQSGTSYVDGVPTAISRPEASVDKDAAAQQASREQVGQGAAPQILFGDLHVHTHYSADAHLQAVRIRHREGASPPADACDFARFCSQLDFWSINDHAESLTPDHWRETVEAIDQCNAAAGDPADPDLVSFLGWEWSHAAFLDSDEHYGHKNVVLRDFDAAAIPTRPIASVSGSPWLFLAIGAVAPLFSEAGLGEWSDFHRYSRDVMGVPDCPTGVPVRDLPADCRESAADPAGLFAKLKEWGFPALVIPHGLSWGTTNPPHANLANQLAQHDPTLQPLLEIYSGHGNSEVFRDFKRPSQQADGSWTCPTNGEDFSLCCERAATLVRERCDVKDSDACDREVDEAVQLVAAAEGSFGTPTIAVDGFESSDWGECNQLLGSFLPAFDYRPRQSAQYGLALKNGEAARGDDKRFRWGFIGASDTHRSRPGTGYKEFARELMTDGVGYPVPDGYQDERSNSYYYTGGLAAVHAGARDRTSIFDALKQRHVYGTSGDRILLWFDVVLPDGSKRPMGSEVVLTENPQFEVRAVGAFEQKPGCADFVASALTPARVASLCRGECYHPSDTRKVIERIEIVRIRPQQTTGEEIRPLIEDPWRSFACPGDQAGCSIEFTDPDFAIDGRESVYYARAIQAPTPAINGDPMSCTRNATGVCVDLSPCATDASGLPEDCLAEIGERAWSSP